MSVTYRTQAIVLTRSAWREYDVRLLVHTPKGKLELVARGAKKPTSKLSAHIEPFNFIDLMVVVGKQFDYLGAVLAQEVFLNIKSNLSKIKLAGRAANLIRALLAEQSADKDVFFLTQKFFYLLNKNSTQQKQDQFLFDLFVFKLLSLLGYKPHLQTCVLCGRTIKPSGVWFDAQAGGLVCSYCQPSALAVKLNLNGVKSLRLAQSLDLADFSRVRLGDWTNEFSQVVSLLDRYYQS